MLQLIHANIVIQTIAAMFILGLSVHEAVTSRR